MESFIYRNNSEKLFPLNNYIKIQLEGDRQNINAIGSTVSLYIRDQMLYLDQMPIRGFQSTVDNNLILLPRRVRLEDSFSFDLIIIVDSTTTKSVQISKSKYILGIRKGYSIYSDNFIDF